MHGGWRRLHMRCVSVWDELLLRRRTKAAHRCCWHQLCLLLVASLALEHEECLHEQLVRGADGSTCWINHPCSAGMQIRAAEHVQFSPEIFLGLFTAISTMLDV